MAQNATIMRQIFAKFWINYKINRVKQFLILKSILDKKNQFFGVKIANFWKKYNQKFNETPKL